MRISDWSSDVCSSDLLSKTREDRAMKHSVDVLTNDRPVMALQDEYPAGFIDPMHSHDHIQILYASAGVMSVRTPETSFVRSEEHTSELQSLMRISYAVFCLKKKTTIHQ